MAKHSIKKEFDTNGSTLGYPVSPASPQPQASVNDPNGILHFKYSNQGDPSTPNQAYDNFGAGATGYNVPSVSQLGEAARAYQEPVNRFKNNTPEGASF
jgi:hypothetical protein|tara:strand:- start:394 stop:690 length:297 start_codon:yes stop_codon:yes gene_type:complete